LVTIRRLSWWNAAWITGFVHALKVPEGEA
jgi:hypothetical protein